ncbi:hypothetical protein AKJ57_06260 [candidate division MSBL1 archaeon SCGC-AAA259A05]|uniref:SD-repeat containing protein B domain-containing protein n=1 Tax=candidate division MSBL1 archaeon SCGC-AAA259A05 TaxID=1698259 RepID=A0A133U3S3_9EURY|nr:hypothetical protein AKJ57_06260 [candidate division MSBL1 archaeon SCGC-AAA259A05]
MYVWEISWKEAGPHLKTTVTIKTDSDGDGVAESSDDPVEDATVDFTLSLDSDGDGSYDDDNQSYTGTTNSKGQVEFMWKHAPSGDYKGEVTDLTHSSYD